LNSSQGRNIVPTHFDYLIVGGGMVANFASEAIRDRDSSSTIGILSEEIDGPYPRPALSKKLWTDPDFSWTDLQFDTAGKNNADLHLQTRVTAIDRDLKVVATEAGDTFSYSKLLIATGGRPKRVDLPEDDRVIWFRTARDYKKLRAISEQHAHVVVVGGGYIGTELAAALIENGSRVTLVFPDDVLAASVFPLDLAEAFQAEFLERGVELRAGATVVRGSADVDGITLELDDGTTITADAVVSGLGIKPNVELARAAGLVVADGIVVDDQLKTSDAAIFAAGDVAEYPDVLLGRRRVEHVDNATAMGNTAGHNMAGAGEHYDHTPYYYSVIFETRYEAVGTLDASLETVEDWTVPLATGVIYYLNDGLVVGVLLWNIEGKLDEARKAIAEARALTRDTLPGLISA
jgi:NADPH-dependent 2,4-dienoyl-CoA reductase/sulfur reductase-like enzyme